VAEETILGEDSKSKYVAALGGYKSLELTYRFLIEATAAAIVVYIQVRLPQADYVDR
jgi:hypothetical protein